MADQILLDFTIESDNAAAGIENIKKGLQDVEKQTAKTNQETKKQIGLLDQLDAEYKQLEADRRKATDPQAVKNYTKLIESNRKEVDKLTRSQKELGSETKKTGKDTKDLTSNLSRIAENLPFGGIISQIRNMGGATADAAKGASKSGSIIGGAFRMAFGPIGILIALIGSVIAYFKRTDEGAAKLEGIMKGLGLIFDALMVPVEKLGEMIVWAFENPKKAISTLVDYVIKAVEIMYLPWVTLGKVISRALTGDFAGAKQAIVDAGNTYKDLANGLVDTFNSVTKSLEETAAAAKKAMEEGTKLAFLFDNLEDKQRSFRLETAKSESQIKQLLIAARNRTLSAQERLDIIQKASDIESQNAAKSRAIAEDNFKLTMLDVLAKEQVYELEGITLDQIKEQIKAGGKVAALDSLSIGYLKQKIQGVSDLGKLQDDQSDRLVDAELALQSELDKSLEIREKIKVRYDALIEMQYAEEIKAEQDKNKLVAIEYEKMLRDKQMSNEEFNILQIHAQIDTLEKQKEINKRYGKETIDIDKAIVEAQIKLQEYMASEQKKIEDGALKDSQKTKEEYLKGLEREYQLKINALKNIEKEQLALTVKDAEKQKVITEGLNEELLRLEKEKLEEIIGSNKLTNDELFAAEMELDEKKRNLEDLRRKREEDKEKQHQETMKQIKSAALDILSDQLKNIADINAQAKQAELEQELTTLNESTNAQIAALDKQRNAKVISEEKYNAQKQKLQDQQAEKEKAVKIKQFEAERQAKLTQVAIETAVAVIKALATLGPVLGPPAALTAGLVGASQAAIILSQPTPKFEKGGIVGGKLHSQGGTLIEAEKGEYIVNRKDSAKHGDLLEHINGGTFEKYLRDSYIVPALRASESRRGQERISQSERIVRAVELNGLDLSHLERITKGNKKVLIDNTSEIADKLASKLNHRNAYIK